MDTFGQRLRSAREAAGLSQASAAKAVGMQQPTLSGLENDGSVRSTFTTALAELYGVSATWLATGKGPRKMPQVIQGAGGIADPEPSPGPAVRGRVPLISSVRAGAFVEARDPFQPGKPPAYESGAPTDNEIDLWKIAAPSIDLIAPDI